MAAATPTEQSVRADLVRVVEGEDGDCEGVEGVGTSVVAVVVPIRSVKLSSNYVTFHRICIHVETSIQTAESMPCYCAFICWIASFNACYTTVFLSLGV